MKPSQAKPSQAKPSQAKPSQAKPSQAITLKFLHFPAFFSGHFAITFFGVNNEN